MLWALGRMGPEVRDAVPVLVEALNSDVPEVRRTADNALVNMGPAVRESLVQLVRNEPKEKDDAKAVAVENVLKRLDEQNLAARRALLGIIVGPAPLPANVGKCPLCP